MYVGGGSMTLHGVTKLESILPKKKCGIHSGVVISRRGIQNNYANKGIGYVTRERSLKFYADSGIIIR